MAVMLRHLDVQQPPASINRAKVWVISWMRPTLFAGVRSVAFGGVGIGRAFGHLFDRDDCRGLAPPHARVGLADGGQGQGLAPAARP